MTTLSVVIITKNAMRVFADCLDSVRKIADEIIILDSGSTDGTLEMARKYTSHVYCTDWPGFGIQKQRAIDYATGDWILSLDADEVLTAKIIRQIKQAIATPNFDAYKLNRLTYFAGQPVRFGDKHYIVRLFRKGTAHFSEDKVHERLICTGKVGRLKAPFLHYTYVSVFDWMQKMNWYTEMSVSDKRKRGKKSSLAKAIFSGVFTFVKYYLVKGAILDGRIGFVVSMNWALGNYFKYLKLAIDENFKYSK